MSTRCWQCTASALCSGGQAMKLEGSEEGWYLHGLELAAEQGLEQSAQKEGKR